MYTLWHGHYGMADYGLTSLVRWLDQDGLRLLAMYAVRISYLYHYNLFDNALLQAADLWSSIWHLVC